ncbi:hypothetical protein GCM10010182_66850 [Actinomadura cremea]|nr:hypothetical protein GCM10010182_66850 [Actinomadura cremea]
MPSPNVGAPVRFFADLFAPTDPRAGGNNTHLFRVRRLPGDRWEARAAYPITTFMAEMGCSPVLQAASMADLTLRATAERVRIGLVRAAEQPPTGGARARRDGGPR